MFVYEFRIKPCGFFTELISSHTIFGAISWALFHLEKESLEEFFEHVKNGKILFSSAMPVIAQRRYFFKPILPSKFFSLEERETLFKDDTEFRIALKKYKKLRFIPEEIFFDFVENDGDTTESFLFKKVWNWLKTSKIDKIYLVHSVPHASLDKLVGSTGEGGEFFFEKSYYISAEELFFLVAFDSSSLDFKERVESAVILLSDWGLGGNRSIGFGRFKFLWSQEFKRSGSPNNDLKGAITLSPVIATGKIDYESSFYDVRVHRGAVDGSFERITTNIWKRRIVYLVEGSIVKTKENESFGGAVVEETFGGKKVYQYGLELPVRFIY